MFIVEYSILKNKNTRSFYSEVEDFLLKETKNIFFKTSRKDKDIWILTMVSAYHNHKNTLVESLVLKYNN